jgi:hypothetical protein
MDIPVNRFSKTTAAQGSTQYTLSTRKGVEKRRLEPYT